jgi:hypothetical protein
MSRELVEASLAKAKAARSLLARSLLAGSLALCAACAGDPVTVSAPVGVSLKARSSEITDGAIACAKPIDTEPGNPYGAFVSDARARIGRDPGIIDVERVELFLGAGSSGVTSLDEVFAGDIDLLFQMNETNNAYLVARGAVDAATGAGPVGFDIAFAAAEVPDLDYVRMLLGSFKLVARGPAAPSFETGGALVDLQVTLTFAALE